MYISEAQKNQEQSAAEPKAADEVCFARIATLAGYLRLLEVHRLTEGAARQRARNHLSYHNITVGSAQLNRQELFFVDRESVGGGVHPAGEPRSIGCGTLGR